MKLEKIFFESHDSAVVNFTGCYTVSGFDSRFQENVLEFIRLQI